MSKWKTIKKIKKPFKSKVFINIEHNIGPDIAPNPKINCKPPPATTNLSFSTKSFVWARFRENNGKQKLVYMPTNKKNSTFLKCNAKESKTETNIKGS